MKKRFPIPFILSIVAVSTCLSVSAGVGGTMIASAAKALISSEKGIESTIAMYMQVMSDRDIDRAVNLFTEHVQGEKLRTDLERQLQDNESTMFGDHAQIEIITLGIRPEYGTDPDAPQGLVARVRGAVTYTDGREGSFDGILEWNNEMWKLYSIDVLSPIEN